LKAKLCTEGLKRTYAYCDANHVPYKRCGKVKQGQSFSPVTSKTYGNFQLVVAVEHDQLTRLDELFQRATQNGVQDIRMLDANQIREIEPNCRVSCLPVERLSHRVS
jgi:L-2-hydroxyglutarate oxidase LhgO